MVTRTAIFFVCAALGWASPALGHPLIEEARQRFESADFDGALAVLTNAENASDLEREDVIDLVEMRALVNEALDNDDAVSRDLRALASLEPSHRFRPEVSPVLVEQFQGISPAPMELHVEVVQEGDRAIIEAVVDNDIGDLVCRIVLRGRVSGRREWHQSEEQRLVIEDTADSVEWSAEVIGPGQARLLVRTGTNDGGSNHAVDDADHAVDGNAPSEAVVDGVHRTAETDGSSTTRRRRMWPIWLSVGIASAVIIGVVVGVVASNGGSDETVQIVGPFVGEN